MAVAAVLDLDEAAGPGGRRGRGAASALAGQHVVLEVDAPQVVVAAHRRGDLVGGADERGHPLIDVPELGGVEVDGAAADEHPLRAAQRPADRLARLGLGLAGDAARVDDVQLRLWLGRLRVTGGEQGAAGEHRIRLGDLATEELDRERGHAPEKVARDLAVRLSCDSRSRPEDLRTPRQQCRAWVSSGRHASRGERALAKSQPEAWAAARRCRGVGHRVSLPSRVGLATVHLLRVWFGITSDVTKDAHWTRDRHGPRVQDSRRGGCPSGAVRRASAAAPPTRPGPGARARRGHARVGGGDAVGLGGQQAAEDQRRRQLTLGRGPGHQRPGEHVGRRARSAPGACSARMSKSRTSSSTPLRAAFSRVAAVAAGS